MIGQTVLHYKILEKLGEGGMGVVYKARDTKLNRLVALKFLPPHLLASEQDKARFIQEAQAASALNQPNVCTIHDIQEHDHELFIVMEYVDGQTLNERKGTIGLKQAIDIGAQIADGLSAAHEKGIVHRDLKPENIMIRKDGIAQIMDFGLAKLRGVSRLTKEGSTVGTAGYMSPEQIQGQDVDHRSDIFSLGVLLYELFTGQLPFRGVHETALQYEIVNVDPAPMSSVKPEIDAELDRIVLECLSKEPSERYQSAAEIAKELRRFKRESGRQRMSRTMSVRELAPRPPAAAVGRLWASSKRWIWMAGAALFLIVVAALVIASKNIFSHVSRQVMRLSIDLPTDEALSGSVEAGLAISRDGQYLVYVGDLPNSQQLYLRRMDQLGVQPIPGTDRALDPAFSADGQWVAYCDRERLAKVSIFGGAPEKICDSHGQTRGIYWADDNSIYFGHINRSIYRVAAGGGTPEPVTVLDSSAGEISHRFPQILPDGKTLLYTIKLNNIASFDDAVIAVQRMGTGERKILIRGGTYATYLPTGHLVYARGNSILAVPFDLDRLEVTGPPEPVETGGMLNPNSGQAEFGVSNAGTLVYAPSGPISFEKVAIAWMNAKGNMQPLVDTVGAYNSAALSPDGQRLAITVLAANNDVWVYDIPRKALTRVTFGGGNNSFPVWSPDGRYLVFNGEKGHVPNLFRVPSNGGGKEERLTTSAYVQIPTSFTPDGKMIAYNQEGDIWILPLEGDRTPQPFIQTPAQEFGAVFSPEGDLVAYTSNESGKDEVYLVPFPSRNGKWQVSTGGGVSPLWSHDGKKLYYMNSSSLMSVDVAIRPALNIGQPVKIYEIPSSATVRAIAPDGKKFVVTVSRTQQFSLAKLNVVLDWFDELKRKFNRNGN